MPLGMLDESKAESQQQLETKRRRKSLKDEALRPAKRRAEPASGLASLEIPEHLSAISSANAIGSPLLRLPAELRTTIFRLALTIPFEEKAWILCENHRGTIRAAATEIENHGFALPLVSRQIYAETATMIYTENSFCFWTSNDMNKWLNRRLKAQRDAIRVLHLHERPMIRDYTYSHDWRITPNLIAATKWQCPNLARLEIEDVNGANMAEVMATFRKVTAILSSGIEKVELALQKIHEAAASGTGTFDL